MATLYQLQQGLFEARDAGDTERQQRISDAIRQHPTFQENSRKKLSLGFNELEGNERQEAIHKHTARSIGIHEKDLDSKRGMGVWGRTKLSFQPTQQDKVKHLEDTYGKENIRGVDIGGDVQFLYRDENETGNKWRRVDEEGVSLADFTADIAGVAPEIAGAVVGGVKGAAAGGAIGASVGGVGAIPGAIIGGVLGAAGGGFATGTAQDVAVRAASGEDIQLGEIAERRAKEAAFGAGIDVATLGTGRFFSRFGGKGLADGLQKSLADASDTLAKRGINVDLTAGMRTGEDAARFESKIAADRPKSKIAGRLAAIRDDMDNFRNQISGDVNSQEAFAKNVESIRANYASLVDEVAQVDKEAANMIQKSLQRKIDRLGSLSGKNMDQFGQRLQRIHSASRGEIDKVNDANFKNLSRMANEQGVSVSKQEVLQSMRRGLSRFKVLDDPNIRNVMKEIEEGADTLTFQELRERLDQVADAVSGSKLAGFSNREKVASAVGGSMRRLRDRVAERASPEFATQFSDTMGYYQDKFLSTRRGAIGTSLAERLGAPSTTPQTAARLILSDPANIRQTIQAAEDAGMSPSVIRGELREAYRDSIGLTRGTTSREGFSYNREVVEELWGKRGVQNLDALNNAIKQGKKNISEISEDEVAELLSAYSERERKEIANKIARRAAAQEEADQLAGNALIKKIISGKIEYFQNDEFAKHLINADKGDAKRFMAQIPANERAGLRQDVISDLFGRASKNAQKTSDGIDMWNPDAMATEIGRHRGTLVEVLGEKTVKEIEAANTILKAAESRGFGRPGVALRGSASGSGAHVFLVGDVFQAAKERFWGWAYGSGALTGLLTGASKDQMEARMKKALPAMLGTSRGIQALQRATSEDPELRERVTEGLQ